MNPHEGEVSFKVFVVEIDAEIGKSHEEELVTMKFLPWDGLGSAEIEIIIAYSMLNPLSLSDSAGLGSDALAPEDKISCGCCGCPSLGQAGLEESRGGSTLGGLGFMEAES